MNWQVQKWAFLLGFLCRKRILACSRSGLFNFRLLFAPANCLEIVYQIRDFRGNCLNFWWFIKKGVKWVLKSQCFVKCLSYIIIEKHLLKFTFNLTFANTNVTGREYIQQKNKKSLICLIKAYLFQNYRLLQFVKLLSERKQLPVKFGTHQ